MLGENSQQVFAQGFINQIEKDYSVNNFHNKTISIPDSEFNVRDVKISTEIPEHLVLQGIEFNLFSIYDDKKNKITGDARFDVKFVDVNNNGVVDAIEWSIPELINKSFILEANITDTSLIDVESKLYNMKEKFDRSFYDKTLNILNAKTMGKLDDHLLAVGYENSSTIFQEEEKYYNIIVIVDGSNQSESSHLVNPDFAKNEFASSLRDNHHAKDIYIGKKLSYVSARVPISELSKIVDSNLVYKIGDGDGKLGMLSFDSMEEARSFINSDIIPSTQFPFSGDGVIISMLDSGMYNDHPDLPFGPNKTIIKEVNCDHIGCHASNLEATTHATRSAGIVAGQGNLSANMKGVAPDSKIYDVRSFVVGNNIEKAILRLANALDWSFQNGADIVSISLARISTCSEYDTLPIIIDEAMDEGLHVVMGAGNNGFLNYTIDALSCGFNNISVGAVDSNGNVWSSSSRGPAVISQEGEEDFVKGRIKPEIVAPGVDVNSTNAFNGYSVDSGTSFAAPFVSGASALILESKPYYTPLEIKGALLLGANWQGPINYTATDYDNDIEQSLPTQLNAFGFGILNVSQSLEYVDDTNGINLLRDSFTDANNIFEIDYEIDVKANKPVKIILSWLMHPVGSIKTATPFPDVPLAQTYSNLDLIVKNSAGQNVTSSESSIQNNEFVVLTPTQDDTYTITVSRQFLSTINGIEYFVLGSTEPFSQIPINNPPNAMSNTINFAVDNVLPFRIPIMGNDIDGDVLSFNIVTEPQNGTLGTIQQIVGQNKAYVNYTANPLINGSDFFEFKVFDGIAESAQAKRVNIARENLVVENATEEVPQDEQGVLQTRFLLQNGEQEVNFAPPDTPVSAVYINTNNPSTTFFFQASPTSSVYVPPVVGSLVVFPEPIELNNVRMTILDGSIGESVKVGYVEGEIQVNQPPVADAGDDQTVDENFLVILDASGSFDTEDEGQMRFTWTQTTGPLIQLSGTEFPGDSSNSERPFFFAPNVTSSTNLIFSLLVKDIHLENDTDSVTITVNDSTSSPPSQNSPVAHAGVDDSINEGTVYTLDASTSEDPDGDTITFSWNQTRGIQVSFSNPNATKPTFTAPEVGGQSQLDFEVTVTDSTGRDDSDTVRVFVQDVPVNNPPIAEPGSNQTAIEVSLVYLDGRSSYDPDDPFQIESYHWSQTSGQPVTISNVNKSATSFVTPSVDGDINLSFELVVHDGEFFSQPKITNVTVQDNVSEEGQVFIPNPELNTDDRFGHSVSATDTYVVVGTPDDHPSGYVDAGEVYLFHKDNGTLALTIPNPQPANNERFGESVALLGTNKVIIGAPGNNTVYLYDDSGTNLLTIPNPGSGSFDDFGFSVSTIGNDILVGAPGNNTNSGAAYIFDGTNGNLLLSIPDPVNGTGSDEFGFSVASLGNNAIVGAPDDPSGGATAAGAVYLIDGNDGSELLQLVNPEPGLQDHFGNAVASVGNNILVGASEDKPSGINDGGSVYLYDGTTGSLLLSIPNPQPEDNDEFGDSVNDVRDKHILIGSPNDNAISQNGGAVYIFDGTETEPVILMNVTHPDPQNDDRFGFSVESFLDDIIIGTPRGDASQTVNVGTTYVFENPLNNIKPVAVAGNNQTVDEVTKVTLDGSKSFDPDDDNIVSYQWNQTAGPSVTLENANSAITTFTPPTIQSDTTLQFQLVVSEATKTSDPDTVFVDVQNLEISEYFGQGISTSFVLGNFTMQPDEVLVLLDTTGIGNLYKLSVSGNVPCKSSLGPNSGAGNDTPDLKILAGTLTNATVLIGTGPDDKGFSGPLGTCTFQDNIKHDPHSTVLNTVIFKNEDNEPITITDDITITIRGVFE